MSKRDKLVQKIIKGSTDITPDEAVKILQMLGFKAAPAGGSHLTFRKACRSSVTIVLTQNPVKPYMVAKLQDTLKQEGYTNDQKK